MPVAACHQDAAGASLCAGVTEQGDQIRPCLKPPALTDLEEAGGCLEQPDGYCCPRASCGPGLSGSAKPACAFPEPEQSFSHP